MIADHCAQAFEAIRAQHKPQFQRAKLPPKRHAPFAVVHDLVETQRVQILGLRGQRAREAGRIADEMHAAMRLRAQPFVRVDDDRVRQLCARPEMAQFRTDHRRTRPCGVDVQIKIMRARNGREFGDWISRANTSCAYIGDDASGHVARFDIGLDQRVERFRIGAAQRAFDRDAHEIVLADAGEPDGSIDRRMRFGRAIDPQTRRARKASRVAFKIERAFAHHEHGGECCG